MADEASFKDYYSVVIFGASGNLAQLKTFPSLFGLFQRGKLSSKCQIIGYARSDLDREEFERRATKGIKNGEDEKIKQFLGITSYIEGKYDVDEDYQKITKRCEEYEKEHNVDKPQRLFYLALPPSQFALVLSHIRKNCYDKKSGNFFRVIIEKPFGRDLKTARQLQEEIAPLFSESSIFRVDHYLGKEMVKNLLVLRFGNELFSSVWNKNNIASIQISFKEAFGTEGRGGYFDDIGIIRDVMQNHLLQVLTLLTMERPTSFDSEAIRDEKTKVLASFDKIDVDNILIGQYGKSEDGKKPSYLDDETVKSDSKCVTYCAFGVNIHNERWDGVPIVLRAGKALDEGKVEIRIQFKPVAKGMFKDIQRNELVIRVQPDEAIYLKINSKIPGVSTETSLTDLDLTYSKRYSKDFWIPQAYESLIMDCLQGNHANFVRDDELDISWKLFDPLLEAIETGKTKAELEIYPYGSKGPKKLKEFLRNHGYVFDDPGTYQWPLTNTDVKGKI
ncbi:unnamed protein product [Candida verbasci]|uniref:Glucose-6-phosphate 1-dehydrogenase n=1 Tax=Candida verbasci TaxID=1227364 RepID=A0A9W4X938_9ASCO|nr:unnamed protein product [Candida verbasci]